MLIISGDHLWLRKAVKEILLSGGPVKCRGIDREQNLLKIRLFDSLNILEPCERKQDPLVIGLMGISKTEKLVRAAAYSTATGSTFDGSVG